MKHLRLLLLPFSFLYATVTYIRNFFFQIGIFKSQIIPGKSICIGNITVGGTGKSPFTLFLAEFLQAHHPVFLSRGYGRNSQGLIEANQQTNTTEIGDEPMMYWKHFKQSVPVVVAEKRQLGVDLIRNKYPESIILLDDAFQHRAVKAGLQFVLMTYERPIFNDYTFPAGNLRETRNGIHRADAVLVTKCPEEIDAQTKQHFAQKLKFNPNRIFYSSIVYGELRGLFGEQWASFENIILVTGIAQPAPLKKQLSTIAHVESLDFPDHHDFSLQDIQKIQQKVAIFAPHSCAIVTTEKDAVRLLTLDTALKGLNVPVFVQEMQLKFDRETELKEFILAYVTNTNERSS